MESKIKGKVVAFLGILFIILPAIFYNSKEVSAVGAYPGDINSVVDFNNIKLVDPNTKIADDGFEIGEEYATVIRYNPKITVTAVGTSADVYKGAFPGKDISVGSKDIANNPRGKHYVQFNNAGIYHGDYFDLRINVVDVNAVNAKTGAFRNESDVLISTRKNTTGGSGGFLQIDFPNTSKNKDAQAYILFEFLKTGTEERIDYRGTWNFKRVNDYKTVSVDTTDERMANILAYDYAKPAKYEAKGDAHYMFYESLNTLKAEPNVVLDIPNRNNFSQFYGLGFSSTSKADLRENFSVCFKADDGVFPMVMTTMPGRQRGWLKYESEPITKMQLPTPQIVSMESERGVYKFEVSQDIPQQASDSFYPYDYKLEVEFDSKVKLPVGLTNFKITNVDGVDVKDKYFKKPYVSADGRKVIFELINPGPTLKNPDFVDNAYTIEMDVLMDGQTDIYGKLDKSYFEGFVKDGKNRGYYRLPMRAQYETKELGNLGTRRSKISEVKSKMIAKTSVTSSKKVTVAQGSTSTEWLTTKTPEDLFNGIEGACLDGEKDEKLVFSSIEPKTFNTPGADKVKVILKGEKSNIEHETTTQIVDVEVLAKRIANIHYVDQDGVKLEDSVKVSGFETKPYNFDKLNDAGQANPDNKIKDIEGYTFSKVQGDPIKGTYPTDDKELNITLVYQINKQPVVIKYLDTIVNNKEISSRKTEDYETGKTYKIKPKAIPGFKFSNVTVDGVKKPVNSEGQLEFPVINKQVNINFNYEPEHMKVEINADKFSATQTEEIFLTTNITSLMKYADDQAINKYADDFLITIYTKNANQNAETPSDIKLTTSTNLDVTGEVLTYPEYFTVKLKANNNILDTENLKLTFKTKVKENAITDSSIRYGAAVKNTYQLNTGTPGDGYESVVSAKEESRTTIGGSLRLVERPMTIDFGKVKYLAKKQRIENPTIDGKLEVVDTRNGNKSWILQATLEEPLKDGTKVLPSKVTYKTDTDDIPLNSGAQDVYTNKQQNDRVVVSDSWGTTPGSKGVKLDIDSKDELKEGTYSGKIRWSIVEGP